MSRLHLLVSPLLLTACLASPTLAISGEIPRVALSEQHRAMCKVGVGDTLPKLMLTTPNGDEQALQPLFGKELTVIVFYQGHAEQKLGWMTRTLLRDLGPDVAKRFGKRGVAVIAIRADKAPEPAADYLSLADPDGKALAELGEGKLPRVYVVDPKGKVLWFDIEYSHATRRELRQTLIARVGDPAQAVAVAPK